MPRDTSTAQSNASEQDGQRSPEGPSTDDAPRSALDGEMDNLCARTVALAHNETLCAERCTDVA
jgi:hypothetical protein